MIRTELVLRVGAADLSWYAVNKNVTRLRGDGHGPDADSRGWFELYLARQVMIAEALAQGYGQRPEVLQVVDAMERHMLAQLDETITAPTEAEVRAEYERAPADRARPPFEEIRGVIEQALVHQRKQEAAQARRIEVSQRAELVIVTEVAEQLIQRIQSSVSATITVTDKTVGPLALAVIATYHLGDARTELTVAAWQHRFNEQFVRVMPATVAQLQESIRDLVAKEYGWHNARRRGLDREPQFVEDRRNFLYYQALDLFEQEKLRPRIEITREEAEACYRREILEFTKPLRARGRLLRFRDLADAQGWMRTRDGSAVLVAEAIEVSRQSPIPGGEKLIERILDFPDGRPFGPIRTPSGLVVFFKETTERGRRPYAEVADLIRSKLAQRKLEALELTLAREWAPRYVIEDRLHPQEFGVTDPVEKPWVARN